MSLIINEVISEKKVWKQNVPKLFFISLLIHHDRHIVHYLIH